MRRSTRTIFFLLLFMVLGCKKEEPNPELLDPIWKDLDSRAASAEKSIEEEKKKQSDLDVSLRKSEPNTLERRNAERDLEKSKRMALDLDQKLRYYKIRANRRKIVDKITYKEAFAKNKAWPDPSEYSDYQVNMRLNEVNLNWNSRVPKLQSRLSKSSGKEEKAKQTAKAEE